MVRIAPSILSADFTRLGEEAKAAEAAGVDMLHLDVMDGHFVPNITIGPAVVEAIRKITSLPLDVHLMIEEPDKFLGEFVKAGADYLTVHVEAAVHLHRTVHWVRDHRLLSRYFAGITIYGQCDVKLEDNSVDRSNYHVHDFNDNESVSSAYIIAVARKRSKSR